MAIVEKKEDNNGRLEGSEVGIGRARAPMRACRENQEVVDGGAWRWLAGVGSFGDAVEASLIVLA
jgi:hypothetical protein